MSGRSVKFSRPFNTCQRRKFFGLLREANSGLALTRETKSKIESQLVRVPGNQRVS